MLDAKARGVAYVDKDEEEWELFQREIETEMTVAQTILVEDRTEATVDRQIEEIDEQMEAWQRYVQHRTISSSYLFTQIQKLHIFPFIQAPPPK